MSERTPSTDRPCLRTDLEVFEGEQNGEVGLIFRDPVHLKPDATFVPKGLLGVLALFDGTRSIETIEIEIGDHGVEPRPGFIEEIVAHLDSRRLLDSPAYRADWAELTEQFAQAPRRPSTSAGSAGYPEDAAALNEALESLIGADRQPIRPSPRGLIAPHIDFARGREGYAQAYRYLAECEPADLYVVLGTGHRGPLRAVTGLRADWETPLGVVPTDRDFVDAVHDALGAPTPDEVFCHREEHSVEFQVVHLQHVAAGRPFRVAGFLCGRLPTTSFGRAEEVRRIVTAFREVVDRTPGRVCFVAGADLAHIGPYFGDARDVDSTVLEALAKDEHERLAFLERGDPAGFHNAIQAKTPVRLADGGSDPEPNADRVCSTTALRLTAELAGGPAEYLHYGQAASPDGSQAVTFCAFAFGDGSLAREATDGPE